ncbi:MAG: tRNA (adenosine(37)-N6)-dimethylallyltransferase MiaA, partial [Coriobacteriia bacterium]|nr:tRNA (adenosine(37)-N6)-dimethylallyltransferase MiaA [Coriobacteriia bacterium]
GSQVENKMREKWLCYLDENGEEALIEQLKERDALSAELIDPHNHKRVIRALEMWETGDSYYQQALHFKERIPYYDTCYIGLTLPREELYDRINTRVDRMISHGLVEEVRHLKARGLAGTYTAQHAIGYKELFSYLDSQGTLEDAIEEIKKHSRQYAKRQLTWFRGDERIQWIESSDGDIAVMTDRANEIIERFVRGERNEYLV